MLAKRIIPCLDVKDGRVVKGVNFLGLRDAGDPVECAARYDAEGADELTASSTSPPAYEKRGIILDVVRRTAEQAFMPLTVGGGVRTVDDVRDAAARRRRQGLDQHRGGGRSRLRRGRGARASAASASSSPSTRAVAPDEPHCRLPRAAASAAAGLGCDAIPNFSCDAEHARGLGDLHARRPAPHRHRRGEVVPAHGRARRRRDPAHQHGPRRHQGRLRPGAHARGGRRRRRSGDRVGRRRQPGAHARGPDDGKADAVLAASIFHYGEYSIGECKRFLAQHLVRVRT